MILDPKLVQGKTDFEGQQEYVVYGNEGAEMQLDVPFSLESGILTALLHSEKKLIVTPEVKGEACIEIYLNGML